MRVSSGIMLLLLHYYTFSFYLNILYSNFFRGGEEAVSSHNKEDMMLVFHAEREREREREREEGTIKNRARPLYR